MQVTMLKELSYDQSKIRQIADFYHQVELSTEPLTQITRHNPTSKKIPLNTKLPIDIKPLFHLVVQLSYLLYSCHLKKINVYIGKEMLVRPPPRGQNIFLQQIFIEYLLDKEFNRMSETQQEAMSRKFVFVELSKAEGSFGQFICNFILKIRSFTRGYLEKGKNSPEGYYRQMENLNFIIQNFLQNQIRTLSPTTVILSLEESQVFREYSSLLKCFNNSIFVSIRLFHDCKHIYAQLLGLEETVMRQMRNKRDIKEFGGKIEELIEESLRMLMLNQIVINEHSLEDLNQNQKKQRQYVIGELKDKNLETRRYTAKIYIKQKMFKPFSDQRMQQIVKRIQQMKYKNQESSQIKVQDRKNKIGGAKQIQRVFRNQCRIQFQASKKLICVKYVTSIELTLQNADLMMFHCNYMSTNWKNISLEFIEKSSKNKKKERYLAFKTLSFIGDQGSIILKIFTMIDLLMVYAKVIEPILRKNITNVQDYCFKNSLANSKCEHLRNLFLNKIQECYLGLQKKRT